jgi:hypothetical protein
MLAIDDNEVFPHYADIPLFRHRRHTSRQYRLRQKNRPAFALPQPKTGNDYSRYERLAQLRLRHRYISFTLHVFGTAHIQARIVYLAGFSIARFRLAYYLAPHFTIRWIDRPEFLK